MVKLFTIVFFGLLIYQQSFCLGDSTAVHSDDTRFIRIEKPLFFVGGLEGIGIGTTYFGIVEIQASFMILATENAKLKIFLFQKNSSPFMGIGIGREYKGLGGNGESNDWTVIFIGWQFFPFKSKNDRGFWEFSLQRPLYESNSKAFLPTIISFLGGIRIF